MQGVIDKRHTNKGMSWLPAGFIKIIKNNYDVATKVESLVHSESF